MSWITGRSIRDHARTGIVRILRNAITGVYRPRSGWCPPPVLVVLRMTEACNLRCRMCFERGPDISTASWAKGEARTPLSSDQFLALVGLLLEFDSTFYITGGEPLLSRNLLPTLRLLKARGRYVSVNTNGVLLRDRAEELVDARVDRLIVSLDGPREVHNAIRGDTFDAIAAGIEECRAAAARRNVSAPYLRAQCVITPSNVHVLDDVVRTAKELGLNEIRFQHPMFVFPGDDAEVEDRVKECAERVALTSWRMPLEGIPVDILRGQLARIGRGGKGMPLVRHEPPIRLDDLAGYYADKAHPFLDLCLSPWRRLVVSSCGEMGPCQFLWMGSYPENTPRQVWQGENFRMLRRTMTKDGLFKHCVRCCHREYYGVTPGLGIS